MIGAKSGYKDCMDAIKKMFANDCVTKTEFEETLRAYQKSLDELKSVQRDKAALVWEVFLNMQSLVTIQKQSDTMRFRLWFIYIHFPPKIFKM